eukprot:scaffold6781_cov204-Amphora_coffeaeformis.AAC.40
MEGESDEAYRLRYKQVAQARHIKKKQDEHIAAQELIEDIMKTVDGTAKGEVDEWVEMLVTRSIPSRLDGLQQRM